MAAATPDFAGSGSWRGIIPDVGMQNAKTSNEKCKTAVCHFPFCIAGFAFRITFHTLRVPHTPCRIPLDRDDMIP
jgi:hypothetical protein